MCLLMAQYAMHKVPAQMKINLSYSLGVYNASTWHNHNKLTR